MSRYRIQGLAFGLLTLVIGCFTLSYFLKGLCR